MIGMEMAETVHSVNVEPIARLAEKVKSLIGVLERTRAELSQTVEDNQRLQREVDSLGERLASAETAGEETTALLAEREQIRTRVHELLQQLEAIGV